MSSDLHFYALALRAGFGVYLQSYVGGKSGGHAPRRRTRWPERMSLSMRFPKTISPARERLRDFDDRREVEMLDRRRDGGHRVGHRLLTPEVRIQPVQ